MNTLTQEKTPFEKAGYTKDTKFRVLACNGEEYGIPKGSVVRLDFDDGSACPAFVKLTGGDYMYYYLPGATYNHLEVFEGDIEAVIHQTEDQYPHIQVKLSAVDKTPTYRVHFNELYHRDLSKAEAEEIYSLLGIVLNKN